jgi:hypothetical protein
MSETSVNAASAAGNSGADNSAAKNGGEAVKEATKAQGVQVRKAFTALKRHPLGVVALAGAAVALVEVELAVGILAGLGATALLTLKTGSDARHEVLTKGKWAIGRARALKIRPKGSVKRTASSATPEAAATPPAI